MLNTQARKSEKGNPVRELFSEKESEGKGKKVANRVDHLLRSFYLRRIYVGGGEDAITGRRYA